MQPQSCFGAHRLAEFAPRRVMGAVTALLGGGALGWGLTFLVAPHLFLGGAATACYFASWRVMKRSEALIPAAIMLFLLPNSMQHVDRLAAIWPAAYVSVVEYCGLLDRRRERTQMALLDDVFQ